MPEMYIFKPKDEENSLEEECLRKKSPVSKVTSTFLRLLIKIWERQSFVKHYHIFSCYPELSLCILLENTYYILAGYIKNIVFLIGTLL